MARYEGTFPVWGTITWLTAEQGGRASGPPATPWDTYYFAPSKIPPQHDQRR